VNARLVGGYQRVIPLDSEVRFGYPFSGLDKVESKYGSGFGG